MSTHISYSASSKVIVDNRPPALVQWTVQRYCIRQILKRVRSLVGHLCSLYEPGYNTVDYTYVPSVPHISDESGHTVSRHLAGNKARVLLESDDVKLGNGSFEVDSFDKDKLATRVTSDAATSRRLKLRCSLAIWNSRNVCEEPISVE